MSGDDTQVLTFSLGGEDYCVGIDYVAEIVDGGEMTAIPNSDDHVRGVMDLRGRTTTIVDPRLLLNTPDATPESPVTDGGQVRNRIIVLDPETLDMDGRIGWLVSTVEDVTDISDETLESDGVGDSDFLRGLLKRNDGFTLWLDPHKLTA